MKSLSIKANAKVNTILRVVGTRPDGYHDLEMVMVPLSLSDEIELSKIPSGIELKMDGQIDAGMGGERNLAWRAAKTFLDASGVKGGVRIDLKKRIPIAAGLGGGSSDAAAVLRGLNELWSLGWDAARLAALGAGLGADVPFFCHGAAAFVEGIGDRVTPIDNFPNLAFLLINPGFAVSTPWVYRQWDIQNAHNENRALTVESGGVRVRPLFEGFGDVISSLRNDLEAVTVPAHPEIAEIKSILMNAGAAGALMSGSGPTVFGVFEDASVRDRARELTLRRKWRAIAAEVDVD